MNTPAAPRPGLVARVTAWALSLRAVRAFLHYSEHRGPMLADSVTYRTLFSVFAGVLLGFSVAALWLAGNPAAWQALIDAVDAAIPGLVGSIVDPDDIQAPAGLTIAGILSLAGLIGAAIGAIGSLRTALRTLADIVHDDVLFIWVILRNLALAIGIGAALAAAAAAMVLTDVGIGMVTGWVGLTEDDPLAVFVARAGSILIVFLLDATVVAVLFRVLSGVRPSRRVLLTGAALGGVALTVLQQLSSWFVGGASSNPLLATFASLIALLLWLNLSTQAILIASSYMIVASREDADRVRQRHGAPSLTLRRVQRAEDAVHVATDELRHAREAVEKERTEAEKKQREEAAKDDVRRT
ncbi:YihY/virulence factor BrkB family protein [Microbacterium sp. NPDC055910]|uniref:YihY/virulence factor BrkB family protein n=1 Tax=Microbacterium sp. NPDC055910 TaxID=3345659 RepID=UPI0035E3A08D